MSKVQLPVTLTANEFVVVRCERATKQLTVHVGKDSWIIGNYWTAEQTAIPYLMCAFGGDKSLAEQAVTTAFNFNESIVELLPPRCTYPPLIEGKYDEMRALRKIEKKHEPIDDMESGLIVEPMRSPAA